MIGDGDIPRILEALPALRRASPDVLLALRQRAFLARIPAGRDVFVQGQKVDAIPLLISGTVRVYQIGETGREVTLYRFRPGESCVLTANAILTLQSFPAIATVEEEADAVMVPADAFREWVAREDIWRTFFVDMVAQRLATVMTIVDEVAFHRLDQRVAAFLVARMTELAELRRGSRVLEDLGANGLIRSSRGQISVVDLAALEKAAGW